MEANIRPTLANKMISAPNTILSALSKDYRRVLSQWRALIYMRRATETLEPNERRWQQIPTSTADTAPTLRRMQSAGTLESIPSASGCYLVLGPFAKHLPLRELEVLLELNPYTVVTHYSALEHHSLTLDQPKVITAWSGGRGSMNPLGTTEAEWQKIELPTAYWPSKVISQRVDWFRRKFDHSFGVEQDFDGYIPIRITDRERTLIDSLQAPDYAGGIVNVLRAWGIGMDFINLDKIVDYTERYDVRIIRQRVGFISESLGLSHPRFDVWASESVRGGSSKLVSSAPFSSDYSERWNISLNAPIEELMES